MNHVLALLLAGMITALLCNSANGDQYLKKNVYEETDCTGAPVWTIVTINICTAPTADSVIQKYEISNCTADGVSTLYCDDPDCTVCTSSPLNSCYPQQGAGSSNYECVDAIPLPPQGSFVQERFEGENCNGTALSFQSYVKDFCVAGDQVSTLYVCDDEGMLNVVTCQDSGTCSVNCTAGPQNTGCTNVQDPIVAGNSLLISCTSGDALKTTGSSTSTSFSPSGTATTAFTNTTTATTGGSATLTSTGGAQVTTTTGSATLTTNGSFSTTTASGTSATNVAITTTTTTKATAIVTTTAATTSNVASSSSSSSPSSSTGGTLDRTLVIEVAYPTPTSVNLSWELTGANRRRDVFNFVVELLEESTGSYNSDVVYNGTGTSCIVSNLKPQVTYEVDIYYYVGDVLHAFSSKNFSTSSSSDSHSTPIIADGSKNGTSTGIIAGLVVGLFLGILLIALLVFFLIIKKKKKKPIEFDYGAPTGTCIVCVCVCFF
jgi:hypothetical protein